MKIKSEDFRVNPDHGVELKKWPTIVKPFCKSKKRYQELLAKHVEEFGFTAKPSLCVQPLCVAPHLSGMDAAGKDGAVRHVMSGVNPQGCEVFSFKQPARKN